MRGLKSCAPPGPLEFQLFKLQKLTFSLRFASTLPSRSHEGSYRMRAYDLSAVSVLVVEPNELLRHVLSEVLFAFGCQKVVAVGDPVSARTLLHDRSSYDLMLTELDFGQDDGAELIRDIRQHSAWSVCMLPIIALTLDARIDRVALARDSGATELLPKPICTATLYDRIVSLIEQPRPFIQVAGRYFGPDRRNVSRDSDGEKRLAPVAAHA